jgi:hypothetical protein
LDFNRLNLRLLLSVGARQAVAINL